MSSSTTSLTPETADPSGEPDPARVACTVIIVTHNSARHVERLIDSVHEAARSVGIRCLVVDNGSRDDTVGVVRSRSDVEVVEAGRNLGYAGAINVGRAHADPRSSLLILNPDLEFEPGAISHLYDALKEPQVGVAVPMLLNQDGTLYLTLRREPSVTRALGDAIFGSRFHRRPDWLGETIRDRHAYESPRDVAWAGGAAMLVSAGCNDAVGDWDERRFFLYSEETDFAARARDCGYRVRYVPSARARHEDGGSGRTPALSALLAVNRVRYYEKYHRRPLTSLFRIAVGLHHLLRAFKPDDRLAFRTVCRRSAWSRLPGRA